MKMITSPKLTRIAQVVDSSAVDDGIAINVHGNMRRQSTLHEGSRDRYVLMMKQQLFVGRMRCIWFGEGGGRIAINRALSETSGPHEKLAKTAEILKGQRTEKGERSARQTGDVT